MLLPWCFRGALWMPRVGTRRSAATLPRRHRHPVPRGHRHDGHRLAGRDPYDSYHLRLRATVALLGPPLLASTYTTWPG